MEKATHVLSWEAQGIYSASTRLEVLPMPDFSLGTYAVLCLQGINVICFSIGAGSWQVNNILVDSVGGGTFLALTLFSVYYFTL